MIKDYFPFPTAREGQKGTLEKLQEAYDSDYKYFILDAPVGSGKSAIARALCNYLWNERTKKSYLLTPTIQLQEQYETDTKNDIYAKYHVGKGRSNFNCEFESDFNKGLITTADNGTCTYDYEYFKGIKCYECNYDGDCEFQESEAYDIKYNCCNKCPERMNSLCDYYNNKRATHRAECAIINYDILLSDHTYKERFNMVCDEAHNIENKIMGAINFKLSKKQLKKYNLNFDKYIFPDNAEECVEPLEDLEDDLEHRRAEFEEKALNTSEIEEQKAYKKLVKQAENLITRVNELRNHLFIYKVKWFVIKDKKLKTVEFKPLNVSEFAEELLFAKTNFHLLMSGTIIDKLKYCECLGLSPDEVYYWKQPSTFNLKLNNPLIIDYAGRMNYREKKKTLPILCEKVKMILKKHKEDKGIIHCWSRGLAKQITENIGDKRFLNYNNKYEKEEQLDYFEKSEENPVLMGYSLEEGVNLPDEHIRFQIFCKAPYSSLGDPQIKERANTDNDWYTMEAMRTLIQMQGRGMRHENDYCKNYIIDGSFDRILKHRLLPDDVKNSIIRL